MKFINTKLTAAILISMGLAACSPDKTSSEYLTSAKTNIASNNKNEAIIELKNAIRTDLKNPEARLLLGTLYVNDGQAAAAEKELLKALNLGIDKNSVLPKLFKAYHLQDKNEDTLALAEQHPDISDDIKPIVLLYTAIAQSKLGDNDKAKETIAEANDLSAESVFSRLGNAYLQPNSANIDDTLSTLNQILVEEPELTEALLLKGQLQSIKKDYTGAITAFNQYFQLLPNDIKIRLYLANAYVKNAQFKEADEHLTFLLNLIPEHPFSNQLKGVVYFQDNNYKLALSHTEKAIQNGLNSAANKIIAGLSAFHLKQYEQSHQYLISVKDNLPNSHPVKKILAMTQMQLGYTDDASQTLESLESLTEADSTLLTSASYELLKSGKITEAKSLLGKANTLAGDNSEAIAKVGILQLSMNDIEGLANLEKALELDPELPMAKMALAAAYIQNKEYDKTLALAEKWQQDQPELMEGYNLAAKVLLLQNKVDDAEKTMQQALTIKADNAYSLLYFSNKHLQNNELPEALQTIDKLLASAPDHIPALIQHYRINTLLKTPEKSLEKIKSSFDKNQDKLNYRVTYARALYSNKQFTEVTTLLDNVKDVSEVTPDIYWMLLGDSYIKSNQNDQALSTYDDWIKNRPNLKQAWLQKISLQEKTNDISGALTTVQAALKKSPDDMQLKALLINFYIEDKQISEAQLQLDGLSAEQKELVFFKAMQGKIWYAQDKFDKALPNLKSLYELQPSSRTTLYVVSTLKALKRNQDAFEFINDHVIKYPTDNLSKIALAELAIEFDKNLALNTYQELLAVSPENGTFLNNIAWVEYLLGSYKSAEQHVTKAISILGEHPQVLDSAGLIKLKLGLKDEAIALLEKANKLAPDDDEIALHLKQAKK